MQKIVLSLVFFFVFGTLVNAQKKSLTPEDYSKWQSIGSSELSPNGAG